MNLVYKIPLVGPAIGTAKGAKTAYDTIMDAKALYNSKDGIIKKGVKTVKVFNKGTKAYQQLAKNVPKLMSDASKAMKVLGVANPAGFVVSEGISHVAAGVTQHLKTSQQRHQVLGLMAEADSAWAVIKRSKDVLYRKGLSIADKTWGADGFFSKKSHKIRSFMSKAGDVFMSYDKKLFTPYEDGFIEVDHVQIAGLLRLDNLAKVARTKIESMNAFQDKYGNKYVFERDSTTGVAKLRQFWDGPNFQFLTEDKYIEGEWPRLEDLHTKYFAELKSTINLANELKENMKYVKEDSHTTRDLLIKERRIREIRDMLGVNTEVPVVPKRLIEALIDRAVSEGIPTDTIKEILQGKEISDKVYSEVDAVFEGKPINKFDEIGNIGLTIDNIMDLKANVLETQQKLAELSPSLREDVGNFRTIAFYNVIGGLADYFSNHALGTALGMIGTISVIIGVYAAKTTGKGFIALAKYGISKLFKSKKIEMPKPKKGSKSKSINEMSEAEIRAKIAADAEKFSLGSIENYINRSKNETIKDYWKEVYNKKVFHDQPIRDDPEDVTGIGEVDLAPQTQALAIRPGIRASGAFNLDALGLERYGGEKRGRPRSNSEVDPYEPIGSWINNLPQPDPNPPARQRPAGGMLPSASDLRRVKQEMAERWDDEVIQDAQVVQSIPLNLQEDLPQAPPLPPPPRPRIVLNEHNLPPPVQEVPPAPPAPAPISILPRMPGISIPQPVSNLNQNQNPNRNRMPRRGRGRRRTRPVPRVYNPVGAGISLAPPGPGSFFVANNPDPTVSWEAWGPSLPVELYKTVKTALGFERRAKKLETKKKWRAAAELLDRAGLP